ncbi:MAG: DEAD/DEAH box helicase [Chlamydiales bacterium]|nr:DEAD/DEAH box helicase [Chlamydiia bacterium]MCP5507582.1 DEAD/DEAH box helicase [Chlamydiales bacterium]
MTKFTELSLEPSIIEALNKIGYQEATPIQAEAIPKIQEGNDLIALAETGSGKTAACAIPICNRIDTNHNYIQALIVVPTRELALQYAMETARIGSVKGVETFAVYGGDSMDIQMSKLRHKVHVLVATPGRLIDFIYSRQIDLSQVETLILDEADEMLSMGFVDDLEFIINCLYHEHQTLLFSATMPKDIRTIAMRHMKEPQELSLIQERKTPRSITHQFRYCLPKDRDEILADLISELSPKQSIIFCQSRIQTEKVCQALRRKVKNVDFLHGGLNQDLRSSITHKFRTGKIKHMVATDVAARGLDFSGVSHVFIYQLSEDPDLYVHRSGRTGRHDRHGISTTLVTKYEMRTMEKVQKKLGKEPEWIGAPPPKPSSTKSKDKPQHSRRPSSRRPRSLKSQKPADS